METVFYITLILWFAYYLVNHSELAPFVWARNRIMPKLPRPVQYAAQCAVCFPFWALAAVSLFTGWNYMPLLVPPCVLMWDLSYRRLKQSSQ